VAGNAASPVVREVVVVPLAVGPVSGLVLGVTHVWQSVSVPGSFVDAVVVAGPASLNGTDPGVVEVRNVTGSSFEVRFREWDYKAPGFHAGEDVSFVVVERGVTTLASGAVIEAGTVSTVSDTFATVPLVGGFGAAPVVVSTVNSTLAAPTPVVAPRIMGVSTTGFDLRVQQQESLGAGGTGDVNWIAWSVGSNGGSDGFIWETFTLPASHVFSPVTFTETYAQACVVGDMNTFNGSDPATVRHQNLTSTGIEVQVDEEQSLNGEITHTTETISGLVINCT